MDRDELRAAFRAEVSKARRAILDDYEPGIGALLDALADVADAHALGDGSCELAEVDEETAAVLVVLGWTPPGQQPTAELEPASAPKPPAPRRTTRRRAGSG